MATGYHVAQFNIGKVLAPVEEPLMADFMDQLDEINALADGSPGFIWRLQTEEGNATAIHAFDDPMLLLNMSVWNNVESLYEFAYRTDHLRVLRDKARWFEKHETVYQVLWWVPAGHIPTLDEAKDKLGALEANGPSPNAFTFAKRFPPPDQG